MKRTLLSVALSLSCLATASAFAADGYVTGNVNLRAGPDISYPSVDMLPAGTEVAIYGCVDGWSWCDVSTGDDRGWVAGSFLQEEYEGRRVFVADYGVQIGIPIVSFVFGTYWDDHYRNRSWYSDRDHWSHISPSYRPVTSPTHRSTHGGRTAPQAYHSEHSAQPYQGRPVNAQHDAPRPAAPRPAARTAPRPQEHAPAQQRNDKEHNDKQHDDKDHGH